MVVNKRKKVTKYRAHTTHGGGHRKKRRGAGSRGGRGNAGTGKRASQKVAGLKSKGIGIHGGFTSKTISEKAVTLNYFTAKTLNQLVEKKLITKENDFYSIDLAKLGYQKLLSTGDTKLKLKIKVRKVTPRAEEKVKAAGGEIISEDVQEASPETSTK
jgi:large subunit ribosomal protein L15